MNKIFIVGNLTRDPELRSTSAGIPVCTFSVAVNRRRTAEAGQPEADFFRVTTWRQLAENCNRYLAKGRKVAVVGDISLNKYKDANGLPRYSMEVTADEVEFLTSRLEQGAAPGGAPQQSADDRAGFVQVDPGDDLPF